MNREVGWACVPAAAPSATASARARRAARRRASSRRGPAPAAVEASTRRGKYNFGPIRNVPRHGTEFLGRGWAIKREGKDRITREGWRGRLCHLKAGVCTIILRACSRLLTTTSSFFLCTVTAMPGRRASKSMCVLSGRTARGGGRRCPSRQNASTPRQTHTRTHARAHTRTRASQDVHVQAVWREADWGFTRSLFILHVPTCLRACLLVVFVCAPAAMLCCSRASSAKISLSPKRRMKYVIQV